MISLAQIESDLTVAMKAKDPIAVGVLRGLKTRVQNERIAKITELEGSDLSEAQIIALVRSEVKRRKEAAESFTKGNRPELAQKELSEAGILEKYLPAAMPESELIALVEKEIAENNYTVKDFGVAMGKLKAKAGASADGATLAKLLKEKLK